MTETQTVALLTFLASIVGAWLSARASNRKTGVDLQGVVDNRVRLVLDQMDRRVRSLEDEVKALQEREREWESMFRQILPKLDAHEPGLIRELRDIYPNLKL